jgi:lipopolysaccharide export system permease protein
VDFEQYQWQLNDGGNEPFRARGKDERELTLFELFANLQASTTVISAHRIGAELHNNLARVVSILFLPFLAIPLGMTNLRIGQAWGIGAALVVLITFEKVLQLGESLGAVGVIPAWSGAWPPVVGLAVVGVVLFRRAAYTASEPPIVVFNGWANHMYEMLARLLRLHSR